MKKYKLLKNETKQHDGRTLYRIEALRDFGDVRAGDDGGWVESEANLSHFGECWVYDEACVYGEAYVSGDAQVSDKAHIYGSARIYEQAFVYDKAKVYDKAIAHDKVRICGKSNVCGNAWISGNAWIDGDSVVKSIEDYIVFKNNWSSGRYFTWTRSNNMWTVGCFYGTGEELIKKAYEDSKLSGKMYESYVEHVENMLEIRGVE